MRFYYNNTVPIGDLRQEAEEGENAVVGSYTYGNGGPIPRRNANTGKKCRQNNQQQSSGAHAFCGNCGVHILRAPSQDSDVLEINANCLEDNHDQGRGSACDGNSEQGENEVMMRPTTLSIPYNNFETVSENEPLSWEMNDNFNSVARGNDSDHALFTTTTDFYQSFWESLEDDRRNNTQNHPNTSNSNIPRKESISSTSYTHPESFAATNESDSAAPLFAAHSSVAESDDYSMESSSITAASISFGGGISSHYGPGTHSGHSNGIGSTNGSVSGNVSGSIHGKGPFHNGGSSRVRSDQSVKTMPPRWMDESASIGSMNSPNVPFAMGERSLRSRYGASTGNYRSGRLISGAQSVGGTGIHGSSWSVSSLDPNDLDEDVSMLGGSPMTVSPRMRDQMKKYMDRHMGRGKKKEK